MKEQSELEKVVFLDRDGVINQDSSDYIKNPDEFVFLPNSLEAIKLLKKNGFHIIVITNQSVINRKMITPEGLDNIFSKMTSQIKSCGGEIKDIFFCPHIPTDHCDCRKPKPGLLKQAYEKYKMDLKKSFMVGDSAKDIEVARGAGCGHAILVKTGNGLKAEKYLKENKILPDFIADDLLDAVHWIIKHQQ